MAITVSCIGNIKLAEPSRSTESNTVPKCIEPFRKSQQEAGGSRGLQISACGMRNEVIADFQFAIFDLKSRWAAVRRS